LDLSNVLLCDFCAYLRKDLDTESDVIVYYVNKSYHMFWNENVNHNT